MVRSMINRNANTPNNRQVPFTPFMPLSRMMEQVFSDDPFFALAPVALGRDQSTGMALDFGEDEHNYLVQASLPGFSESDITCEVNDGILTIRAEKTDEHEDSDKTWHRRERRFGSVIRHIQLPAPVVEDQAQAELANGVLTLRLPKVQKAPPRKIAIKGGSKSDGVNQSEGTGRKDPHASNGQPTPEPRQSRMAGANR